MPAKIAFRWINKNRIFRAGRDAGPYRPLEFDKRIKSKILAVAITLKLEFFRRASLRNVHMRDFLFVPFL